MSEMMDYNSLKKKALEKYFDNLNDMQKEAVFSIKGPLLILAGAGSGKTTVLVNRIANMIFFGDAYNDKTEFAGNGAAELEFLKRFAEGEETDSVRLRDIVAVNCINPWNILAITFTNKAAKELRDRLEKMLGKNAEGICAATFHSACVRILRREIEGHLGGHYNSKFTIYDSDDSVRLIKSILSDNDISVKLFPPKSLLSAISSHKDKMLTPEHMRNEAGSDYRQQIVAKIYREYQNRLQNSNAMDFDDIINLTVRLFEENSNVLNHYQNLYKYILVDEFQDTNTVQYRLVAMLSEKNGNICVVGDDDQSIYKFRGATIENILSFEDSFDTCKIIKLEQNYRSTQNILSSANALIQNNRNRKGKNLWTSSGDGEKVTVYRAASDFGESRFVVDTILENVSKGLKYNDHAILYRMNAQSNSIERALISGGIPYKIFGGLKFYDRKEIKDILSYLAVINNPFDILRLRRIINEPKRKIGDATLLSLEQVTSDLGISAIDVMRQSADLAPLAKKAKALTDLANIFDELTKLAEEEPLDVLLDELMKKSGYERYLIEQGDEGAMRLENINELKSTMAQYMEQSEEPSLSGFLEEVALFTDIDNLDENSDYVMLMTTHASKGLEFPCVFVIGMEEGIFPSQRSFDTEEDLEEERRLAYVAITRAKEKLYISHAIERMLFGNRSYNKQSRFIKELPAECVEHNEEKGIVEAITNSQPPQTVSSMSLQEQLAYKKRAMQGNNNAVLQNFEVGERVKHNIFGEGTIVTVSKMSNDTLLEVSFDKVGTKKIMANFAKIQKL